MSEDFLHFVWMFQLLDKPLYSTDGEPINVVHPGYKNTDGGPDFFNAKIKIGQTLWAGNIEIHSKSSDWEKHHHSGNKKYQRLVLHVVYENDQPYISGESFVATIELKNKIPLQLIEKYQNLIENKNEILCQSYLHQVSKIDRLSYMEKLFVERLERKTKEISETYRATQNNWNETFYRVLLKYLGGKINQLPFEMLAKALPLKIILKHHHNLLQTEALLFGQAGFLSSPSDDYQKKLAEEYLFLSKKYQLRPVKAELWKFLRLRPPNFPTIRLAQLSKILHKKPLLFQSMIDGMSYTALKDVLSVYPSEYWKTHYVFGKTSAEKEKQLGENAINTLIINAITPVLFTYYKHTKNEDFLKKAFSFVETLPPENNNIIKKWMQAGITPENSMQSQALIELKNEKCNRKQCLNCNFGTKILHL